MNRVREGSRSPHEVTTEQKRNGDKSLQVWNRRFESSLTPDVGSVFPSSLNVTLKYTQKAVTLPVSATPVSQYVFRANSLFAPDFTLGAGNTAHQPMGLDTYSDFYNEYTVLRSRIRVESNLVQATAFTSTGHLVVVRSDNQAYNFSSTNINRGFEDPKSTFALFPAIGTASVVVVNDFNVQRDTLGEGVPARYAQLDPEQHSNVGSNPTDQWYYHIAFISDSSATTLQIVTVHMEFDVLFTSRTDLFTS